MISCGSVLVSRAACAGILGMCHRVVDSNAHPTPAARVPGTVDLSGPGEHRARRSGDCSDRIRFSLSDKSGVLRFEDFDIVGQPDCRQMAERLRGILLGRPLADIDVAEIRRVSCPGNAECMRAVAEIIEDTKATFARSLTDSRREAIH